MPNHFRLRAPAQGTAALLCVLACASALCATATAAPADDLRAIVASGRLADLRWPDFPDYQADVQSFYEAGGYAPAWSRDGQPSPRAQELIAVLKRAEYKGLEPEDYDASRWDERVRHLGEPGMAARFDAALTVCMMRYLSDLHVGRVNPAHLKFKLAVRNSSFELPQFLRQDVLASANLAPELEAVEPPYQRYRLTRDALARYLALERSGDGATVPVPAKTVEAGGHYTGAPQLAQRLQLLGDLAADASVTRDETYQAPLVAAVQRFQQRHGLTADGRLGAQTVKAINVPLHFRVQQLKLTMERWRWLPHEFPQPPVVVNIPEFRLRAFDDNARIVLSMNVIVGKAMRHETPVFARDMRYVVFRPYWNVPPSIQRSEIVPAIQRDRSYIARKGYEVTTHAGALVTDGAISDEVLEQLRTGKLAVRQKPGPRNALGLVKLIFPNEFNVYLHSTPSEQLFSRSRRDFSHGCIRVEKPEELAAWALRRNEGWDLARVQATMQGDKDNVQVNLANPIPVLIIYGTAVTEEDGSVHFFDDIYGHDADLAKALAKGYPYNR
jgi:murein L,D-transpeptidase YcbB/YkuD